MKLKSILIVASVAGATLYFWKHKRPTVAVDAEQPKSAVSSSDRSDETTPTSSIHVPSIAPSEPVAVDASNPNAELNPPVPKHADPYAVDSLGELRQKLDALAQENPDAALKSLQQSYRDPNLSPTQRSDLVRYAFRFSADRPAETSKFALEVLKGLSHRDSPVRGDDEILRAGIDLYAVTAPSKDALLKEGAEIYRRMRDPRLKSEFLRLLPNKRPDIDLSEFRQAFQGGS